MHAFCMKVCLVTKEIRYVNFSGKQFYLLIKQLYEIGPRMDGKKSQMQLNLLSKGLFLRAYTLLQTFYPTANLKLPCKQITVLIKGTIMYWAISLIFNPIDLYIRKHKMTVLEKLFKSTESLN